MPSVLEDELTAAFPADGLHTDSDPSKDPTDHMTLPLATFWRRRTDEMQRSFSLSLFYVLCDSYFESVSSLWSIDDLLHNNHKLFQVTINSKISANMEKIIFKYKNVNLKQIWFVWPKTFILKIKTGAGWFWNIHLGLYFKRFYLSTFFLFGKKKDQEKEAIYGVKILHAWLEFDAVKINTGSPFPIKCPK